LCGRNFTKRIWSTKTNPGLKNTSHIAAFFLMGSEMQLENLTEMVIPSSLAARHALPLQGEIQQQLGDDN
jgi:hypothetical protein